VDDTGAAAAGLSDALGIGAVTGVGAAVVAAGPLEGPARVVARAGIEVAPVASTAGGGDVDRAGAGRLLPLPAEGTAVVTEVLAPAGERDGSDSASVSSGTAADSSENDAPPPGGVDGGGAGAVGGVGGVVGAVALVVAAVGVVGTVETARGGGPGAVGAVAKEVYTGGGGATIASGATAGRGT